VKGIKNSDNNREAHMSTIALPERSPVTTAARKRLKGPILLATDGTAQSRGAFAAAACIAAFGTRRTEPIAKLSVRVVTVCDEALPIVFPGVPHEVAAGRRAEMLGSALAQVRYNVADTSNWRVDVLAGAPAPAIAIAAAETRASLVIMGLGKHDLLDRVFGTETALRVMRASSVPILAVPENWIGVPRKVLIAVDFGPASLRAARTAMRIIPPGGEVCFAYVASNSGLPNVDKGLSELYRNNLNEEFDSFVAAVGVPDDVTVARSRLYGDTARALLDWASANAVDMIVTGTQANALTRLIVGSVASELVRGAHCAVLVASAPRRKDTTDADTAALRSRPSWHRDIAAL
jgi:nucleotide-binding universal stress UspA family protein